MMINIGCCGSSGSTFLAKTLDKHPEIACGDELNFLSKPILYNNYNKVKLLSSLFKRYGVPSTPYSKSCSFFNHLKSYNLTKDKVWKWVNNSSNIKELASQFERYILNYTNKKIWAEKTPRNIYTVKSFLEQFPDSKFIHIVRDPRDVILSLISRNYSIVQAAERWLISVASVQRVNNQENVLEIRYEDLILNYDSIMKEICDFINVEYKKGYFESYKYNSKQLHKHSGKNSWLNNPKDFVSKNSLYKYKDSKIKFNKIYSMKLTKEFSSFLNISQYSLINLASKYNYDINLDNLKVDFKNKEVNYKRSHSNKMLLYNFLIRNNNYINRVIY